MNGIPSSSGIAIGEVLIYEKPVIDFIDRKCDVSKELSIFEKARIKTIDDYQEFILNAKDSLSDKELAIFDGYIMLMKDQEYLSHITKRINSGMSAELAVESFKTKMLSVLEKMDSEYFKERAVDIKDISYRLICNILGIEHSDLSHINRDVIVVCKDLTPSDTIQIDSMHILGIVDEGGGITSHSSIIARSMEIPALVGVSDALKNLKSGDKVILDAIEGRLITNPSFQDVQRYESIKDEYLASREALKDFVNKKSISLDGHEVELASNVGSLKEVDQALKYASNGLGLFRTEFMYLDSMPSEQTQYEIFKEALKKMHGQKVVVRTLDIGGDKKPDYFDVPVEANPFLGYRAIRLCLDQKDIFKVQIRALLRASIFGKLCIMFPMIATVKEFKQAKQFVYDQKNDLLNEGYKVSDDIEIGMMIEIPSSAIMAYEYAKYADFFSIGTNDLIQYVMAADRMSDKVSYLYQPLHPAILRLIKMTIDGGHANGIWVGMCGEMANDPLAIKLLLGLGLDEFSMNASSLLQAKKVICESDYSKLEKIANEALKLDSQEKVIELLKNS